MTKEENVWVTKGYKLLIAASRSQSQKRKRKNVENKYISSFSFIKKKKTFLFSQFSLLTLQPFYFHCFIISINKHTYTHIFYGQSFFDWLYSLKLSH